MNKRIDPNIDDVGETKKVNSNNYIRSNRENLERVLNDFQIKGQVVEIHIGPAVTQYEVKVPSGTKFIRLSWSLQTFFYWFFFYIF